MSCSTSGSSALTGEMPRLSSLIFQKLRVTGALDADDELGRAAFLIGRVGHDRGHDGADKAEADDHDDLLAGFALLGGKRVQTSEFRLVILARG